MSIDPPETSKPFDMEATLDVLEKLVHEEGRSSEDIAALKTVAKALYFLHRLDKLDDFADYLREPEAVAEREMRIEHSFASMSEALDWLRAQKEPRFGAKVMVAGGPHVVVRQRTWSLIPAPPLPPYEPDEKP